MMIEKELQMSNELKSWEEMSVLEQMQCQFWDMYKDAYGVRPRGIDTTDWTEEQFMAEFETLGRVIEREEADRKEREAEAVVKFEQHVTNTICMGAKDRTTALRWIMDAGHANGDWEYFCYLNGLPYGYFREAA
jgi:hypothetical protein